MKKTLLPYAAAMLIAGVAQAQSPVITNGSFETWTSIPGLVSLERPNNWYGSDQMVNTTIGPLLFTMGLDFDSNQQLFQDTDSYEGTYSAKLMTKHFGDTLKTMPVLLTNAKQNIAISQLLGADLENIDLMNIFKFTEQTPVFGKRIDSVTAYVQTPLSNQDDAGAFVLAYKKVNADSSALVGSGMVSIAPNSGGYVKITVPVDYQSSGVTDSVVIGFVSSASAGNVDGYFEDNTLYVDKVEIYASNEVSIHGPKQADLGFVVYPNPATNYIRFENNNLENGATLIIQNAVGQIMHFQNLSQSGATVDLSQYASGTYFYEIYNQKGDAKQSGKFVK